MSLPMRTSPSALVLAACELRWGYRYLTDAPETPEVQEARAKQSGRLLGIECHAVGEAWHKHATPPDVTTVPGRIFAAGIHLGPPPRRYKSEHKVRWAFERRRYSMVVDLMAPGHTIDFKFTSNLDYAKTPEELAKDPQAILYALYNALAHRLPRKQPQRCTWIYHSTKSPYKALTVEHTYGTFSDVLAAYRHYAEPRKRRLDLIQETSIPLEQLKPNQNHCNDYGRCDFASICEWSS